MDNLKFYNVKTRESVEISEDKVEYVTMKNGKRAAKTEVTNPDGSKTKLFRIVGK